ncbi:MAG TPA: NAD-dependent succinate-semialdehyde dehydrogenase [Gemmatimonadaceae bacterium]|nr:NAD-dependent succinate-semialdehyde dehydrogenase [Gemmatimonadaceae bacterium]
MPIATVNPATGETLRTFSPVSDVELEQRVAAAARAFGAWRERPAAERAAVVRAAGELLERDKERYGRLMTLEMGKTLKAAVQEAEKCALGCRWYADNAQRILAPEVVEDGDGHRGEVRFQPLGAVLAIMPWNFPFWQVVRFAAPALTAGNVALLKHASNVPQCALALEELFLRAGAPEGVFQTLLLESARVEPLLGDARVAAATLTGSEGAGRSVARAAGAALKKTVLELGGSDPFVVTASADVARAARVAVQARVINNGQSCIAAKRFVVVDAVFDEFAEHFVAGMRALKVGDPMASDTDVGPLATRQILEDLERQVASAVAGGARVLCGGRRRDGAGWYYEPTVLADAPPDSPVVRDETFGPVAALLRARDTTDALRLANASTFGLGASAWTRDAAEAERLAAELEAGTVTINAMVASDPRYPFGGIKRSGYGRELSSYGLREFVNVKTVRVASGGAPSPASSHTE